MVFGQTEVDDKVVPAIVNLVCTRLTDVSTHPQLSRSIRSRSRPPMSSSMAPQARGENVSIFSDRITCHRQRMSRRT